MGLVLDSSVLIAAEREARPISQLLSELRASEGADSIVISAVSVMELEHGFWRATAPSVMQHRRLYLDEIFSVIPVQPFTREIAQLAARIDAESRKRGVVIPVTDLQIGVTALHLGYPLGTLNVRHFEMIPGLQVLSL